jgi:hypothetical protein
VHLAVGLSEAVVRDDGHDDGAVPLRGRPQLSDETVDLGERLEHGRARGSALVLLLVERREVAEVQPRLLALEQEGAEGGAPAVRLDRPLVARRVRSDRRLRLPEQAGSGEQTVELLVLRVLAAPVLREVVRDASARRRGPLDGGRDEARLRGGIPECRDLDVLRVPEPAVEVPAERVERSVGDDPVTGGRDAGDDRGVAGIGDGGEHAGHAGRVGAVGHQPPEVGNRGAVSVGFRHVVGTEAVDRHQEQRDRRGGARRDEKGEDRDDGGDRKGAHGGLW